MTQTQISEIASLAEGQTLEYVSGQITKIEPYVGARNPESADVTNAEKFTCQRLHITQGVNTVVVKVWDRKEYSQDYIGKVIHIMSKRDDKKRLIGVRTKAESGRDGKKIYLNCLKEADVSFEKPVDVAVTAKVETVPTDKPAKSSDSFEALPEAKPKTAATSPASQTQTNKPTGGTKHAPQTGMRVGMAMNQACSNLTGRGLPLEPKAVTEMASDLLRIAEWLEAGNLLPEYKERNAAK